MVRNGKVKNVELLGGAGRKCLPLLGEANGKDPLLFLVRGGDDDSPRPRGGMQRCLDEGCGWLALPSSISHFILFWKPQPIGVQFCPTFQSQGSRAVGRGKSQSLPRGKGALVPLPPSCSAAAFVLESWTGSGPWRLNYFCMGLLSLVVVQTLSLLVLADLLAESLGHREDGTRENLFRGW